MTKLITTLGPKTADELGLILPHEHIFVEFRPPDHPGHAVAEVADVVALMAPEVKKVQALGVTAMVDCTPVGVGRRADTLMAVSEATGMPLVAPTGIYREPWVPAWGQAASEAELTEWMLSELQGEIEGSGVQAGWIKLSVGDDGITDCEAKILRAAARAGKETNAVIGVHTKRGRVVRDQLNIIEAAGYTAERFIWIHTQSDPDFNLHLEMARRGAWLEYDGIGTGDDEYYLEHIQRVLDAGLVDQMMLSHDRGWYDPAKPGGGVPKPFTYLFEEFMPKLATAGVDEATIHHLMHDNPYRAFAR
ncbi:MAG: esterase [Anaerolineales bacterium]|nr:esterase [Anaerolineales bacterium]